MREPWCSLSCLIIQMQHNNLEMNLLFSCEKMWMCEGDSWTPTKTGLGTLRSCGSHLLICSCSSLQLVGYLEGLFFSQRSSFPVTCSFQWTNQLGDMKPHSFRSLSFVSLFKNKMLKESCGHRKKNNFSTVAREWKHLREEKTLKVENCVILWGECWD